MECDDLAACCRRRESPKGRFAAITHVFEFVYIREGEDWIYMNTRDRDFTSSWGTRKTITQLSQDDIPCEKQGFCAACVSHMASLVSRYH